MFLPSHSRICSDNMLRAVLLAALAALAAGVPIDAPGCGQRPNSRIVGGSPVDPYTWPFICSLQNLNDNWHFCGGSLIRNQAGTYFFVTAAHCVSSGNYKQWKALCGAHRNNIDPSVKPNAQVFTFAGKTVHPNYNPNTLVNDVAILSLVNQPTPSEYVQPVCVSTLPHHDGEIGTVLGWGTTSSGGPVSPILLHVDKPILSDQTCRQYLGTEYVSSNMLCAGDPVNGGVDSCQGDSGGPFVVERDGNIELVGIVSWGYGCAAPNYPGVYADVNDLKYWMGTIINA